MLNELFQALSDSTRRQILKMLKDKDLTAGQIAGVFDMSKPSISHHLNVLKKAGLIESERNGQNIVYSLNMTVMQEALLEFFNYFKKEGSQGEQG